AYVLLRMVGVLRDLGDRLSQQRKVVPHAVAVLIPGACAFVVRPVRVGVLGVDVQVFTRPGEEAVLDRQGVAIGVLGPIRGFLGHVVHMRPVEYRLARYPGISQSVQTARGPAAELSGGLGEIDAHDLSFCSSGGGGVPCSDGTVKEGAGCDRPADDGGPASRCHTYSFVLWAATRPAHGE